MATVSPPSADGQPLTLDERHKSSQIQDSTRNSEGHLASSELKKRLRKERIENRDVVIDLLKNMGNDEYKAGNWEAAANVYAQIISYYGPNSVLFSNLSAALLKLNKNAEAEMVATDALKVDPLNLKARFRRGMARKGQGRLRTAGYDFTSVMMMDRLNDETFNACKDLAIELENLESKFGAKWKDPPNLDPIMKNHEGDEEWPHIDLAPETEYEEVSDSEDSRHFANGVPCKDYNRDGCSMGKSCRFAHCADALSWRDDIGRNVCILYLLGNCKIPDCKYAHDRAHMPPGWWDDRSLVRELKKEMRKDEPTNLISYVKAFFHCPDLPDGDAAFTRQTPKLVRHVLVLYLDRPNERYSKVMDMRATHSKLKFVSARSQAEAIRNLGDPRFTTVLVADEAILEAQYATLSSRLVTFTRTGGTVLFCIDFSAFVEPEKLDELFQNTWNLPWRAGSYDLCTATPNKTHPIFQQRITFPEIYEANVLHLRNVSSVDAVYKPTGSAEIPVVFAAYGDGHVGYIGDLDWEDESFQIQVGMINMRKKKPSSRLKGTPAQIEKAKEAIASLPKVSYHDFFRERRQGFQLVGMDKSTLQTKTREVSRLIPVKPPPRPFILVTSVINHLSGIDEAIVLRGLDFRRSIDLLSAPDLKAVFVGSCDILEPQFAYFVYRIAEYTKAGGTVIFGGCVTGHIKPHEIKRFYEHWGVNWEIGNLTTCELEMNPNHHLLKDAHPKIKDALPVKPKLEVQHALGVTPEDVLYAADPLGRYGQGAVVFTKVGKGHLGYIGNKEVGMLPEFPKTLVRLMLGISP